MEIEKERENYKKKLKIILILEGKVERQIDRYTERKIENDCETREKKKFLKGYDF